VSHQYGADVRYRADVFVFAVQTQHEPDAYDVLDITHWEFWVASARIIRQQALKTVGIGWVRQHATGPLPYGQLADAIHAAATSWVTWRQPRRMAERGRFTGRPQQRSCALAEDDRFQAAPQPRFWPADILICRVLAARPYAGL
jgi:hypothetical protein